MQQFCMVASHCLGRAGLYFGGFCDDAYHFLTVSTGRSENTKGGREAGKVRVANAFSSYPRDLTVDLPSPKLLQSSYALRAGLQGSQVPRYCALPPSPTKYRTRLRWRLVHGGCIREICVISQRQLFSFL